MPRPHRNDKVMWKDSFTTKALQAVAKGLKQTKLVADDMGVSTKRAHAFLQISVERRNLTATPFAYGGATRLKWAMTSRGRRKLKQLL